MGEQICPNCNAHNQDEALYCYACGHILPAGLRALKTNVLDGKDLKPQIRWGTAYFGNQMFLRIHISHTAELIEARFESECILGRLMDEADHGIDLTPYNAVEMGVSRRHAKLTRQDATVMVQDLESVNGTYLNGERLLPYQPRVLRNEDELQLGHMLMRISFIRAPHRS